MQLTREEGKIQERALKFARANKKEIARRIADPDVYPSEEAPVSVFMAGSPGAGKTEASIELLDRIQRSLKKGRAVQVLYVYQEPRLAWEFVQAREGTEGRRIRPEDFIDQYFAAREVVNALKRKFGADVMVDLLLKNTDNTRKLYKAGVDQIDNHVPEKYDRKSLKRLLGIREE